MTPPLLPLCNVVHPAVYHALPFFPVLCQLGYVGAVNLGLPENLFPVQERFPLLPRELIAEEFSARKMLLDNLNLTIALEAILLQTGENASDASAHAAALKMSLLPLWNTFEVFAAKRLQLRKKALVGCFPENPHVRNLVSSSPFSAGLFSSSAIQELNRQVLLQAKPILVLLEFKAPSKRS